jgi:hypothetical protein
MSKNKKVVDKDYQRYVNLCESDGIKPMNYDKWKVSVRPQDENLVKKWKGAKTAPSVWEKRERDPAYAHSMRDSMGMAWGIGKPRGPGKNS